MLWLYIYSRRNFIRGLNFMNGRKEDANGKRIRARDGDILSGCDEMAEGRHDTRSRASELWSVAHSSNPSSAFSEAREQAEEGQTSKSEEGGEVIDPFSLPYVMMSEIRYLPTYSCLYFAIEDNQHIVYIGQCRDIRRRWRAHHVQSDLCDLNDLEAARRVKIAWLEVSDVDSLPQLERAMIRRFRPRLNAVHNGDEKPVKIVAPKAPRIRTPNGNQYRRREARKRYMERMKVLTPKVLEFRIAKEAMWMARADIEWVERPQRLVRWRDRRDGQEYEKRLSNDEDAYSFIYKNILRPNGYLEDARRAILAEYTVVDRLPEPIPEIDWPKPKKGRGAK